MNAIVYSIHAEEGELLKNYTFWQLLQSVKSLRTFNQDIPVYVFISPLFAHDGLDYLDHHNVYIVPFEAKADPRLEHKIFAKWTSHKWSNSLYLLENLSLDNVLYIDTDTIFFKDPQIFFDKYGNKSLAYGKPDVSDKYTKIFNAKNGGMNDGQFLLNKKILEHKDAILKERVEYVLRLQEKFKDEKDDDIKINGVQWVSCQFAISDYLYNIGEPLQWFDEEDVYIVHKINEFVELPKEYLKNLALVHYLNYNQIHFCKPAYDVYEKARGRG